MKKKISNYSNEFERLEFLGDRILGFVISKKLIELYPNEKEGVLDKKLASLVNNNKCLEVAKTIGLDRIDMSKQIYAVEGPLDSLFLDNCIAVGGSDLNKLESDVIIIFDNEPRNKEIC